VLNSLRETRGHVTVVLLGSAQDNFFDNFVVHARTVWMFGTVVTERILALYAPQLPRRCGCVASTYAPPSDFAGCMLRAARCLLPGACLR
jgi:hypothetical protein